MILVDIYNGALVVRSSYLFLHKAVSLDLSSTTVVGPFTQYGTYITLQAVITINS
jgi:hypothetical protein